MESNNNRNYMRNLILTTLIAICSTFAIAQTQPTLPAGTTPYSSSIFKATDGDLWTGRVGGYTNMGNKAWMTTQLGTKQNTLVSGTDIKTINGTTIMGSGNLVIDLPIVVKNPYTLIDVGGLATRDTLITYPVGYYLLPQGGNIDDAVIDGTLTQTLQDNAVRLQYSGPAGNIGKTLNVYFIRVKK